MTSGATSALLARIGRDGDGDGDGTTARFAARGLVRELARGGHASTSASAVLRELCSGNVHAQAQDELARGIVDVVRERSVSASECVAELTSGTASARTSANVRALTRAIVDVCCSDFVDDELIRQCANGNGHPMTRALKAHRDSGAGLLEALSNKLTSGTMRDFDVMRTFIAKALLEYPAPVPRSSFPGLLHAKLMGVASGCGENSNAVLQLCAKLLRVYRTPTSESRAWVASIAADVIDTIECRIYDRDDESGRDLVPLVAEGLSRQIRSAAHDGDSSLSFIGALKRLSELGDISVCAELIPCLSQMQSADDAVSLLALVAPHFPTGGAARSLSSMHASSTLTLLKDSGARLALSLGTPRCKMESGTSECRDERLKNGFKTQERFVSEVLSMSWDANSTNKALHSCLARDSSNSLALEFACLAHPRCSTREDAAKALGRKLGSKLKLANGSSNITAILIRLKAECERLPDSQNARSILSILYALASGASDFMAVPAILRAVSPLLSVKEGEKSSDPKLHALALRLLAEMWIHNRELGPRLRGALEEASISQEQVVVVGSAAAVRAAAKSHPFRAAELVIPIQNSLKSNFPMAQALALETIDTMCSQDALDFYPALKVVVKHIPDVPDHPLVAAKWLRFVQNGGQDSALFPEAAGMLVEKIWEALNSRKEASVRLEAWNALSRYDPEFLAELQSPTVSTIASAALSENCGDSFNSAVQALRTVAKYEANLLSRTALLTRESQQTSHPPPSDPLIYKVTQTVPRKLLDSQPCAGAHILLFRPLKNKSEFERTMDVKKEKRSRAEAYRNEFKRAVKRMSWGSWWHGSIAAQTWARFARRWFDAEMSTRNVDNGLEELRAEVRASIGTTAIEALQEVSTPDELQNVALFLAAPALVGEGSDSFDLLLSIVEQKESVIGAEKGLYTALGAIAGTLPNSSDSLRPNRVADVIIARMCDSRADSASTMGVAAEALGIICHGLCANGFDVSSSWRADFVRRICGFLCEALSVLGASNSLCESRQFQFYAYNILPPNGDVSDAVIGCTNALCRSLCALDVLDDDNSRRYTFQVIQVLTDACSLGSFSESVALPIAIKSILTHNHTIESETVAMKSLMVVKESGMPMMCSVAGAVLGVMLDHGCAVPMNISLDIIAKISTVVRNDSATCSDRSMAILSLSGVLGVTWDAADSGVMGCAPNGNEGAEFTVPLFWGGEKAKTEAKNVLKTLESFAHAPDTMIPRVLRDVSAWTLARISDKVAQTAVMVGSTANDSKSMVSKDTAIGCMMHSVLEVSNNRPSGAEIRAVAMALDVFQDLPRLPSAGWSNALQRWWRVALSNSDEFGLEKELLQKACIKMCYSHPDSLIGRRTLESLAGLSETEFLHLSSETQHLVLQSIPFACALGTDSKQDIIRQFVRMALRTDTPKDCVLSLWKGLKMISEGAVASAAVEALTPLLNLDEMDMLSHVSTCVKDFHSAALRNEVLKLLPLDIKPVVCAYLFQNGQVTSETLTSLSTWPKSTRVLTLKATAGILQTSSSALRAQMLHETIGLTHDDTIPCMAVLAAAWGPTASLLVLASVEQCVLALPFTLPHLLRSELTGMIDAIASGLLKNLKGKYSSIVADTLIELRQDVTAASFGQMVDAFDY